MSLLFISTCYTCFFPFSFFFFFFFVFCFFFFFFFFSSRRRHTRYIGDWSSDVCSSDLAEPLLWTSQEYSRARAREQRTAFMSCFSTSSKVWQSQLKRIARQADSVLEESTVSGVFSS